MTTEADLGNQIGKEEYKVSLFADDFIYIHIHINLKVLPENSYSRKTPSVKWLYKRLSQKIISPLIYE